MKIRKLLTKTLLAALSMFVGGNAVWAQTLPTPVYFNDFSSTEGLTVVGNGEFITDADSRFGQIFHNDPTNSSAIRTNYLKLPSDVLTHSAESKEMTIGFWVNKKDEDSYFFAPLFAAYGAAPSTSDGTNGKPMFVCETRGLLQLNCAGYCDFGINSDPAGSQFNDGTPYVSTVWLDDAKWHYYTVVLTSTTAKVYVDGELKNGWTVDGTTDGQVISGLFEHGADLSYVTLGGNQAWDWKDADPAFGFDDFAVYDAALTADQIKQVIDKKLYTRVTYDFTSYSSRTLSNSETRAFNGNSTLHYYASNLPEVFDRFAFQFAGTVSIGTDGLYVQRTKGDHVGIVGLSAGDKVKINFSQGEIMVRGNISNWAGITADWSTYTTGKEIPVSVAGNMSLQAKTNCKISSIVIETLTEETMTAPAISTESNGDARRVTITDGVSNLKSGVTTYYTIDGSEPTALSNVYTGPFDVTETCTVKAISISNSSAEKQSGITSEFVNLEVVDNPVMVVTKADNNNRIVTITCTTDGATIYYSETEKTSDDEGWSTYTSPVSTDASTLWAYAMKAGNKSEVVSIATGAGTTVNLAEPTLTHSGVNQYTIANNQSGIVGAPTATLHYQIDGGAEQTTTAASVNIPVSADGVLTYWLTAEGYGATAQTNANIYVSVPLAIATTIDLCTSQLAAWATRGNAVDGLDNYYKYQSGETVVGDGVFAATFGYGNNGENTWRMQQYHGGTKNQYSAESIAILGVREGQVVRVECYGGVPTVNSNLTVMEANTYPNSYSFMVVADGNAILNIPKNTTLTKIYIEQNVVDVTIGTNGYATFASPYALNLATLPEGLTAYKAKVEGTTVKFTQVTEAVQGNTGLLLKGTASAPYSIPVVAEGNDIAESNEFLVNVEGTIFTGDEACYYFAMKAGSNPLLFALFNPSNVAVPSSKAYLKVLKADYDASGARLNFVFDDVVTGIRTIDNQTIDNSSVYDLQGRRVANPARGLYIVNGKKVVIK